MPLYASTCLCAIIVRYVLCTVIVLACVASVSVKQRAKNVVFGVLPGIKMLHLSPCNSLSPNRAETLATQAIIVLDAIDGSIGH